MQKKKQTKKQRHFIVESSVRHIEINLFGYETNSFGQKISLKVKFISCEKFDCSQIFFAVGSVRRYLQSLFPPRFEQILIE